MTEAALYYEAARAGLGDDFLDDIQHAIDAARSYPESGFTAAHGFRRMLVRRFPFTIIYAIDADEIVVVAVAHQRRRPYYWRARV